MLFLANPERSSSSACSCYDGNDDRGGLGDDDNDGDELTSCCVLYGSAAGQVTCDRSYAMHCHNYLPFNCHVINIR